MTEHGKTGVDELGPDFLRMAGEALVAAGGDHEAATRLLVRRVALGRSAAVQRRREAQGGG